MTDKKKRIVCPTRRDARKTWELIAKEERERKRIAAAEREARTGRVAK